MLRGKLYGLTKIMMAAMAAIMILTCCQEHYKQVNLVQYDGKFPDESSENMTIVFSDSAVVNFVVKTPLMNRYHGDKAYMDFPEGIEVTSYTDYGREQAILTAGYAKSIDDSLMQASQNVVIHNIIKDEVIETEQINWDQRARKIYSVVLVKLTKADGSVNWGDGFEADERFTKYTIRHPRGEMVAKDF